MFLATLTRWCTVPHHLAARHSPGAHRAALQMYHYVRVAKSIVSVPERLNWPGRLAGISEGAR